MSGIFYYLMQSSRMYKQHEEQSAISGSSCYSSCICSQQLADTSHARELVFILRT